MDGKPRSKATAASLRGYSALARLGHSPERLAELTPEVVALYSKLTQLWEVDLSGVEMALTFAITDDERT